MKRYVKADYDVYSYDRLVLRGNYTAPAKLAKALDYEIANDDTIVELRAVYHREKNETEISYKYIDVSAREDYRQLDNI